MPKPATPSPQPDPKKWKWCKDEGCKRFHASTYDDNEQEVMREKASWCAVFGEEHCWKHLSEEAKSMYPAKIEKYVKLRHSLDGANLHEVELPQAKLHGINLQGANLYGVNLQGAELYEANLRGAKFWEANLQEADLRLANLQKANLQGINLKKADLSRANLQKAELSHANLQEANFSDANLGGTDISYSNFQGARLSCVNLAGAYIAESNFQKTVLWNSDLRRSTICGANFKEANFHTAYLWEANLTGINLQKANLTNANLQDTKLIGANLQEADLDDVKLSGAFLKGVLLNDAKYLTWKQIERVGEENTKDWKDAQDAYLRLKNHFHQQGQYDDEAKAHYREKLMAKKEAHEECFKKKQPKSFFRWLGLWLLWAVAGFGERWMRTIGWATGTFAFFGLLYWVVSLLGYNLLEGQIGTNIVPITKLLDCLYFSLVTFVTLGFGDIWPAAWVAKIFVGAEVVLGYVFLGMIVVLIARKFGR